MRSVPVLIDAVLPYLPLESSKRYCGASDAALIKVARARILYRFYCFHVDWVTPVYLSLAKGFSVEK